MLQNKPISTHHWQAVDVDQYIFNAKGAELAPELVDELEIVCNIPRFTFEYLSPIWNPEGQYYTPSSFRISSLQINTRDSCRCPSYAKDQVRLSTVRGRGAQIPVGSCVEQPPTGQSGIPHLRSPRTKRRYRVPMSYVTLFASFPSPPPLRSVSCVRRHILMGGYFNSLLTLSTTRTETRDGQSIHI